MGICSKYQHSLGSHKRLISAPQPSIIPQRVNSKNSNLAESDFPCMRKGGKPLKDQSVLALYPLDFTESQSAATNKPQTFILFICVI